MKKNNNADGKNISSKLLITIVIVSFIVLYVACTSGDKKPEKETLVVEGDNNTITTTITISPNVPLDVNDPSNLQEAANFAWNEFIALTWPAKQQGPIDFPRAQPLEGGTYGDKGPSGHVVWETYRHRVEAFPGMGNPNGYDPSKPDYGYASRPAYIYSNGPIPPLDKNSDTTTYPPFANLDEVTQISLNSMYAGVYGSHAGVPPNGTVEGQKILFEAKVNPAYYKYVAQNKYFQSDSPSVQNIKSNSMGYVNTGNDSLYPPPYTNLPASDTKNNLEGSIEIKAAWRRLDPTKEDTSKFYIAKRVRFYSGNGSTGQVNGYIDSDDPGKNGIWGLVALHIIHKTPNAPAFVYATFSQYNNILDSAGNSVEDVDGTTFPQYSGLPPFSPAINIVNSSAPNNPQQAYTTSGSVNTNSPQLYFQNTTGKEAINIGSPTGKLYTDPVVVNRRLHLIPPTIVNANIAAHAAISKVNPKAVWLNYKLVNVQAEPLDYKADSAKINNGLLATYFLANEVVETNPSLQHFSGGLNGLNGTTSNYVYNSYTGKKEYDYNVFIRSTSPAKQFLMGGCMGCHGSQGQKMGGDFSVLLANGRISEPDVVQANQKSKSMAALLTKRYKLKSN